MGVVVAVFDGVEGGVEVRGSVGGIDCGAGECKDKCGRKSHHKVLTAIRVETCRLIAGWGELADDSKKQCQFGWVGAGNAIRKNNANFGEGLRVGGLAHGYIVEAGDRAAEL